MCQSALSQTPAFKKPSMAPPSGRLRLDWGIQTIQTNCVSATFLFDVPTLGDSRLTAPDSSHAANSVHALLFIVATVTHASSVFLENLTGCFRAVNAVAFL